MRIGTKSILFGVHQFAWHPFTVLLAWRKLYRAWPTWREAVAIACHDLGYWGCPNIDGIEGKDHPWFGAWLASKIVGWIAWKRSPDPDFDWLFPRRFSFCLQTFDLALYHSRDTARDQNHPVSKLYAADKFCIFYDPFWLYRLRARLSGEFAEFKLNAIKTGHLQPGATDRQWFDFYRANILARPEIQSLLNPK